MQCFAASREVLPEMRDCALPRQLRRSFVVARRRVVVKTVLRSRVGMYLVWHAGGLERRLERGIGSIDTLIVFRQVAQQRRLDLRHAFRAGRDTI